MNSNKEAVTFRPANGPLRFLTHLGTCLVILVSLFQQPHDAEVWADERSTCPECTIESSGTAHLAREFLLKAIPKLSDISTACPGISAESTQFLSPYQPASYRSFLLQTQFILGPAAHKLVGEMTLYASHFTYDKDPLKPLTLVNYIAFRHEHFAQRIAEAAPKIFPKDSTVVHAAGRYLLFIRRTESPSSADCFTKSAEVFCQALKNAFRAEPPEESFGSLKDVLFVNGTVYDSLRSLTSDEVKRLLNYRDRIVVFSSKNPVDEDGFTIINNLKNVSVLSLGPTPLTDRDVAAVSSAPSLRMLRLGGNRITDAMMESITKVKTLEDLSLRENMITDEGGTLLSRLNNLVSLGLALTMVGDETMRAIAALPRLESLFLAVTKITSKGISHLRGSSSLKYIYFHNTEVDDTAIDALVSMPRLKIVGLSNSKITNKGIQRLKELRPEISLE